MKRMLSKQLVTIVTGRYKLARKLDAHKITKKCLNTGVNNYIFTKPLHYCLP